MNETERDRILRMVSEGALRPNEAAHLLAALAEEPATEGVKSSEAKPEEKAKAKKPMTEVEIQRPDGTHYTMQVPPDLVPMFLKMAQVAIKEAARSAAQETWDGLKTIARNKTEEVKAGVKTRMAGNKTEETPAAAPKQEQQSERRRLIIQMVQNGRITASDAARLIEQLDALQAQEKANAPTSVPTGK